MIHFDAQRRGSCPINNHSLTEDTRRRGSLPTNDNRMHVELHSNGKDRKPLKKSGKYEHDLRFKLHHSSRGKKQPVFLHSDLEHGGHSPNEDVVDYSNVGHRGNCPVNIQNNPVDTRRRGSLPKYGVVEGDHQASGFFKKKQQVEDVAFQHMEAMGESASSLTNTVRSCTTEVGRFVSELVDMEQLLKSVYKKCHPEQYQDTKSKVIHQPVDWSKYPQSSYTKPSHLRTTNTANCNQHNKTSQ